MSFTIWIIAGGLIGLLVSLALRTVSVDGLLLNATVGIVGAMVGGGVVGPLVGTATIYQRNDFSLSSLGLACLAALVLLIIANFIRRFALEPN
jgi:uncharacterized membrane protein YeaQ/YmgE (transglycosylase-associated protein family)